MIVRRLAELATSSGPMRLSGFGPLGGAIGPRLRPYRPAATADSQSPPADGHSSAGERSNRPVPEGLVSSKQVALYARVSSDRQANDQTIDSQVAGLRERIHGDGFRVTDADCYLDEGISGATLVRPALERLRDRAADGALDRLYIYSPDRLARKHAYQVLLLEEFKSNGVEVIFLNRPLTESPEDELLLQVQGMIAEYEKAKILERSRRGKLHRARQGCVSVLSSAPYGYRYIRKGPGIEARYEVNPEEARVARAIFEWVVGEHKPLAEMARLLNRQGVPTPRGATRWQPGTLWGILRNPAYAGRACFGKTQVCERKNITGMARFRHVFPKRARSSNQRKDPKDWIAIAVPGIVSEEAFTAAQEQLIRNQRVSPRNARPGRYLLQGLLLCRQCGYSLYGKPNSRVTPDGRHRRYAYYRCGGSDAHRFGGRRLCGQRQLRVEHLDGLVWDNVSQALRDPRRMLQECMRRRRRHPKGESWLREQLAHAEGDVKRAEGVVGRLIDAYEAGAFELQEFQHRIARARQRSGQLQKRVSELKEKLTEWTSSLRIVDDFAQFAKQLTAGFDKMSFAERQKVVRLLIDRVEVDGEGVTIVYQIPPSAPRKEGGRQAQNSSIAPEAS